MRKERLAAVTSFLTKKKLDAILVTNFYNILYLTGLKTLSPHEREAYLLITRKKAYVFTDGRYEEQFREMAPFELRVLTPQRHILKQLQELAKQHRLGNIGFEREDLKWSEYDALERIFPGGLTPVDRLILGQRAIKNGEEVENISRACHLGDECLAYAVKNIRPGMSEKQIAWEMEKWVREKGYTFSFDPIVAVDANAAIPHYNTREGNSKVGNNSLILIDMGVACDGYCSDITRVFFTGQPDTVIQNAYRSLVEIQSATIEELKRIHDLNLADLYCRRRLEDEGYPSYSHSTGHGVGLEVHEYPKVSLMSRDTKTAGQVFTVEPGIYMPGKWGMRIEDTVTFTGKGIRALTRFPK